MGHSLLRVRAGGEARCNPCPGSLLLVSEIMKRAVPDTRKIGRPRVDATQIGLRLRPEQLAALDAWIAVQPDKPSRPEAIRQLLTMSLPDHGRGVLAA
jgi:hypothetical protein